MLSVKPSSAADAAIGAFAEATKLRLEAVPPGTCPIAMVTAHAELCASQTCGKCVPCREGLPQLARSAHPCGGESMPCSAHRCQPVPWHR